MEILKDKKILVGGLAVIGGIALVAYLLKPKAPKRNSEGFFNAIGNNRSLINKEIPSPFYREDRFCKVCVKYAKIPAPNGKSITVKSIYNPSNPISELMAITEQEFQLAFIKNPMCRVDTPSN
jgi:hypothetical protein